MHVYLKSIGFSKIENTKEQEAIIRDVIQNCDTKKVVENKEHRLFAEFSKEYAYDCGITVCGEYDENDEFHMEYYYPYYKGGQITSYEDVAIERHAGKESFAGACDDIRLGITMIFYLINAADYLNMEESELFHQIHPSLTLSALAKEGTIIMPVKKDPDQAEKDKLIAKQKNSLIEAARDGDEDAIESLTMEDIDTYAMISRRIVNEDVFSIVESYFMPCGLECDQYNVMGEITDVNTTVNSLTGEKLYQMGLICNDVPFDVCINEKDLYGEPAVGRRFKGLIWLQGMLEY
ncbi:MAG: DUF3881 family protein [Fusicatenibacter sp.]|nr:DUF3881 family protein [Lachnospiraceae bacterium]MDY2937532.1 DUF3881 family protein [Fusicatenibacter sp.]